MSENDPAARGENPLHASQPAPAPTHPAGSRRESIRKAWHAVRWLLWRAMAVAGMFLFFLLMLTGAAGWYTSRPQFCRSCHIMEPYYKSWQESTHSDVSCIECHFSPGFGGKIRGKMLGLVQLAKYVTGSAGARPSAEIPDASCLRSGCHETRLLAGRVEFQGIPFDHTPHLGETRRGMTLRCTSCHSQIVQGKHMTVTPTTCFLCHFKEGRFNEGLGTCTRCHQIPDKKFDLGGGVMFSHDLAYDRGVDCANCHGDLIRGKGEVPRERCTVCHNREDDLKKIDDHPFMHRMHVTEHKIDCLSCHLAIQHSLDRHKIAHAVADCASCHPNHHREQVDMLGGIGAKSVPSSPSSMMVARTECRTCHRTPETTPTGTVLLKGSTEICGMCHTPEKVTELVEYHKALRASLPEVQVAIQRAREALAAAKLSPESAAAVSGDLASAQHDLDFLRAGNDIHNMHYASKLNLALLDRVSALCRELRVEGPKLKVAIPAKPAE